MDASSGPRPELHISRVRRKQSPSGILYHLMSVEWSWFVTLTFGMQKVPDPENPGKKLVKSTRVPPPHIRYWALGNLWTYMVIEPPVSETLAVWFSDFLEQTVAERGVLRRLRHDVIRAAMRSPRPDREPHPDANAGLWRGTKGRRPHSTSLSPRWPCVLPEPRRPRLCCSSTWDMSM